MSQLAGKFLQDASILFRKLAQNGANTNDALVWNGTAWVPTRLGPVIQSFTTTTTLVNTEQDVVLVNATQAVTITLFSITGRKRALKIKKIGAGQVTVNSSDLMDGSSSVVLRNKDAMELIPSGGTWYIF